MVYRVKIVPRAERDLAGIYDWIGAQSSDAALTWYHGLAEAIRTWRNNPSRCPVTPEDPRLRHLLYGARPHVYRVIYRILQKKRQVDVLHIRHAARQEIQTGEL